MRGKYAKWKQHEAAAAVAAASACCYITRKDIKTKISLLMTWEQ